MASIYDDFDRAQRELREKNSREASEQSKRTQERNTVRKALNELVREIVELCDHLGLQRAALVRREHEKKLFTGNLKTIWSPTGEIAYAFGDKVLCCNGNMRHESNESLPTPNTSYYSYEYFKSNDPYEVFRKASLRIKQELNVQKILREGRLWDDSDFVFVDGQLHEYVYFDSSPPSPMTNSLKENLLRSVALQQQHENHMRS